MNDSITALRAIQSGASSNVKTAVKIANMAAANCSPANSMPMEDLVQYPAPESLASFHIQTAVNNLVTWGFPLARRVPTDVATLVTAKAPDAIARASAQLGKDQRALDAQRARINQVINAASTSLSAHVAPPSLPSLASLFWAGSGVRGPTWSYSDICDIWVACSADEQSRQRIAIVCVTEP